MVVAHSPLICSFAMALAGLLLVSVGVAAQPGPTITTLDGSPVNGSVVRSSASVAIGVDGLPILSYVEQNGLKVIKCGNTACTGPNTVTTVDPYTVTDDWLYSNPSIAIGADGLPVISYDVGWKQTLNVAKCPNAACTGASTITTLALEGGSDTSIAIGADGLPVISFLGRDSEQQAVLKVAKCANAACTGTSTITSVDDPPNVDFGDNVGYGSSIAIGADGLPVIGYTDFYGRLRVARCVNAACTGTSTVTIAEVTVYPAPGSGNPSVAIAAGGLPVISYVGSDGTTATLKVMACANAACNSASTVATVVDDPAHWVGLGTSIAIPADGLPVIGYHDDTIQALKVVKCTDAACTTAGTITTVDDPADGHLVGLLPSIAIGADGLPIISYYDDTANAVKVAKCWTADCQATGATTRRLSVSLAGPGSGTVSSMAPAGAIACGATCDALVQAATPVTLTAAAAPGSTFTGWHRPDCPGVGACTVVMTVDTPVTATFEITTHPVPGGPTIATVDFGDAAETSVAIGSDGLPLIAYAQGDGFNNYALKAAKCADAACIGASTITTVDAHGGFGVSIALGTDGLPVISYTNRPALSSGGTLKVAKCANPACTGPSIITAVAMDVSGETSIAVGSDGLPVIGYTDYPAWTLRVAKCANEACTGTSTITVVDTPSSSSSLGEVSIAVGADGLPVVSYDDEMAGMLKVAKCANAACTGTSTITIVDDSSGGWWSSIAIGADGLPVISYGDYGAGALKVAKCANAACTGTSTITTVDEPPHRVGWNTSIAVGPDGLPLITYDDASGPLKVAKCANPACTGASTISSVDPGEQQGARATAIGPDGLPLITLSSSSSLKVVKCTTPTCQPGVAATYSLSVVKAGTGSGTVSSSTPGGALACGMTCVASFNPGTVATLVAVASTGSVFTGWSGAGCSGRGACTVTTTADRVVTATFAVATQSVPGGPTVTTVDAPPGGAGGSTSIAVGADGLPVISYRDDAARGLKVAKCANAACTGASTVTVVDDPANDVGWYSSIAVGADGLPVISYHDQTAFALKVARCVNPTCTGTSTITTVDATGGWYSSIAVGADGLPVISYSGSGLKVAKCADAACTGTSTITTVDLDGGGYTSIAIGADGFPIISFVDERAGALKVAKCANVVCTGPITITTVDGPPLRRVEEYTSIAVGPDGLPVIAYMASDTKGTALRVARCVNPACTGTSTITVVDDPAHVNSVGAYPAIAIGADGFPVISYQDQTAGTLKVARCHNGACTGASTITVVDGPGFSNNFNSVGTYTSIAIGADGFPVIAYQDDTAATLKVARCWTATCRSGEEATARLAVERAGTGGGAVSSTTPAGAIACGATCDASFDVGTMVTLARHALCRFALHRVGARGLPGNGYLHPDDDRRHHRDCDLRPGRNRR